MEGNRPVCRQQLETCQRCPSPQGAVHARWWPREDKAGPHLLDKQDKAEVVLSSSGDPWELSQQAEIHKAQS